MDVATRTIELFIPRTAPPVPAVVPSVASDALTGRAARSSVRSVPVAIRREVGDNSAGSAVSARRVPAMAPTVPSSTRTADVSAVRLPPRPVEPSDAVPPAPANAPTAASTASRSMSRAAAFPLARSARLVELNAPVESAADEDPFARRSASALAVRTAAKGFSAAARGDIVAAAFRTKRETAATEAAAAAELSFAFVLLPLSKNSANGRGAAIKTDVYATPMAANASTVNNTILTDPPLPLLKASVVLSAEAVDVGARGTPGQSATLRKAVWLDKMSATIACPEPSAAAAGMKGGNKESPVRTRN